MFACDRALGEHCVCVSYERITWWWRRRRRWRQFLFKFQCISFGGNVVWCSWLWVGWQSGGMVQLHI